MKQTLIIKTYTELERKILPRQIDDLEIVHDDENIKFITLVDADCNKIVLSIDELQTAINKMKAR